MSPSSTSYENVYLDMGRMYGACMWGTAGVRPAGVAMPLERPPGAPHRVGRAGWSKRLDVNVSLSRERTFLPSF